MEEILIPLTDNDDIYRETVKKHLNDRRIIINDEISDALLESVCLMILRWNQEDKNNCRGANGQGTAVKTAAKELRHCS